MEQWIYMYVWNIGWINGCTCMYNVLIDGILDGSMDEPMDIHVHVCTMY